MKKPVIMLSCLLYILISLNTFAKTTATLKNKNELRDTSPANIIKGFALYPDIKNYSNSVNIKIMRAFIKTYENPSNVVWYKRRWGHVVTFTIDSIENIAAYKNTGMRIYSIKKYPEKKMPASLRHTIKTVYYDYKILLIDEVNMYDQENTIYIVLLQYANHTKQVRVCGSEIQEIFDLYKE